MFPRQKSPLTLMLYLADNLAYIPFTVLDEPLFVVHHIDMMISVSGSNLLQTFKECLRLSPSAEARHNLETGRTEYIYDEDLDNEFDSVLSRLPLFNPSNAHLALLGGETPNEAKSLPWHWSPQLQSLAISRLTLTPSGRTCANTKTDLTQFRPNPGQTKSERKQ